MKPFVPNPSEILKESQHFLNSTSFSRAFLVGFAVTLPIILGIRSGYFEIGLALCFGALWSSPSDVSGSFYQKAVGILISAILVTLVSFIGGYLHFELLLLLPILGLLTFTIAFISVYGFRASLISFSGLMALVLSFAHDSKELEIYQYALLIGLGGIWYLILAKLWSIIYPRAETEEFLSETYLLTAEFLEIRGKLVGPKADRKQLQSRLLELQGELTENHGTLREILILTRRSSGRSNYLDKRLLIFTELVGMLETAISNPVNYDQVDKLFKDYPQYITALQELIFQMSLQLKLIDQAGNDRSKLPKNNILRQSIDDISQRISEWGDLGDYEEFLMIQNILAYHKEQFEKLKRIKRLLGDSDTSEFELIDRKEAKRFVESQDYDPKLLARNLSFRSLIFRHSLRLSVAVMVGYALGSFFTFQNPYWILLTIIVIMRPSYGLTKTRAKDRIIGTLIGGTFALGLIFLVTNPYAYGAMGVVSLIIALAMVQRNYRTSAAFITLSVVFIYAILTPDVLSVVQFRILDTLVGAGLSYLSMLTLWPSWEYVEMRESVEKSVNAIKAFLTSIETYYIQKGDVPTSYKIARKDAFLETSNLSSAFQRMTQEPKSKQREMDKIYELVVLNHTFLASLASLSTYIQHHGTTEASEEFKAATNAIKQNLEQVLNSLKGEKQDIYNPNGKTITVFSKQLSISDLLQDKPPIPMDIGIQRNLQEAHLVWGQLEWLFSISDKMVQLTIKMNWD
ncbi:MAG: FUSC family membrane protein [Bacteroidota bacterium]|nr:FUSC family membrane protein [Bacteroidota bacterium]